MEVGPLCKDGVVILFCHEGITELTGFERMKSLAVQDPK